MDDSASPCLPNSTFRGIAAVAGVNIFFGVVNIILGSLVVSFIFLFKRHHFHSRRLVIYLSICVILLGIKAAIDVHAYIEPIEESGVYCEFCGFLLNYALTAQIIIIFIMTVDTFMLVTCHVNTTRLEIVEVLITFALPLTWIWVPWFYGVYGSSAAICDITRVNYANCTANSTGSDISIYMFAIPFFLVIVIMFVLYVAVIAHLKRSVHAYEGIYNPQAKTVKTEKIRRAKYLLVYPVIYIAFSIMEVVHGFVQVYHPGKYVVVLSLLTVLASNGRGIALLLTYTFEDRETCSQLRCSNLLAACIRCCKGDHIQEYNGAHYVEFGDSLDTAEEKRKINNNKINNITERHYDE